MARPKQSSASLSAKVRIENAFWHLLSEMPYENISIKALSAEANINHNSIYYHFDNIDALAKEAFEHIILKDAGKLLTQFDLNDITTLYQDFQSQPDINERFKKLRLFASSHSLYLQNLLKEGMITTWLDASDIKLHDLSSYDQMEIDLIFTAIISLIGKKNDPSDLEKLMQDDLGQSVIKTMKRILGSHLQNI